MREVRAIDLAAGVAIVEAARSWIGTPFHWEQSRKGEGVDCKGLVAGAARECSRPEADELEARVVGYSRRIDETALVAGLDRLLLRQAFGAELHSGHVLAFRIRHKVQHLAIFAGCDGNGVPRMIHTYSGEPNEVIEARLGTFWGGRLAGVWGWPLLGRDQAATAAGEALRGD